MRLFGLEISRPPATSLFGGEPIDVSKAQGVPAGASVNAAGTERLRGIAAGNTVGSSLPAYGMRPDPGVLPDATKEDPANPFRFQLPWGGNIAYTPRSGYGTPFSILRGLAATSPVLALCIQCRKDQMSSLDWDFAAKDKKAKGDAIASQLTRARAFFAKPDGRRSQKSWIQLIVDEALTLDAVSIYRRPTVKGAAKLKPGSGYKLAPDEISGYEVKDGSTFKVLLGPDGEIPLPPSVAFRQILYGAPVVGGDLTADQLMYRPKTERTWTPYGLSPIESALLIVTADLNRAMFNVAYYTDGNIPEALVGVPDNWSPKVIAQFTEYWDLLLKGDPKNRSKLRFVVQTMAKTVHEFKKPDFTTTYDLWLLKLQCACFGVTPSEIGFTDDVNKATSKMQGDVNQRRGVKPMAAFIKAIHDEILMDLGLGDIEAVWSGGEGEDALSQAKIADLQLRNGSKSLDEIRADNGDDPIGIPNAVITPTGPIFWQKALEQSEEEPEPPVAPVAGAPQPGQPGAEPAPAVDDTQQAALKDELKKYQTVATKAVRAGKPVPAFETAILEPTLHESLIRSLASAADVDTVQKVFADARTRVLKAQRLSPTQKRAQSQMHSKLKGIFASVKKELAAHVASGLEGQS